jgi:hypothetical protein
MAATFVPIHAAGDGAWSWHLVAGELRERGLDVVLVDLPADDESAGLWDYADAVVDAIGERTNLVVVAHSFGGFSGPLVRARVPVRALVMVTAMIPAPGEAPADWWADTRHAEARQEVGGDMDDIATYYHDVPPELAAEAMRRERNHPSDRAYRERGHSRSGPAFLPAFCSAGTTGSSRPIRCVGSSGSDSASPRTRWTPATARC